MIFKTRKPGIAVLTFFCLVGLIGFTPITHAADDDRRASESVHTKTDNNDDRSENRDRGRERHHVRRHYDGGEFRQFIRAELEHVPGLKGRMERLMEIQSERQELQKQRQAVAANPERNRAGTIERFHSLLRRDFALSDESRQIAKDIVNDLPGIQKQLDARGDNLQKELDHVNSINPDATSSSTEAHDLRRKIRYVEFLEKKLGDLEDHPDRLDVLIRMLRGVPFDERPGIEARTPEAHLADLRKRRKELQQELRQVDNEINLLKAKGVGDKKAGEESATPAAPAPQ